MQKGLGNVTFRGCGNNFLCDPSMWQPAMCLTQTEALAYRLYLERVTGKLGYNSAACHALTPAGSF
jgi:hypothetical protein